MLPDHDVYITDWHDAREVPLSSGLFDLEDFIDYLIDFIEFSGRAAMSRDLPAGRLRLSPRSRSWRRTEIPPCRPA